MASTSFELRPRTQPVKSGCGASSSSSATGLGITLSGLSDGAIVHGTVRFKVNAFGAEEPFEPHRAESRSPMPVWVWVLSLVIVAWAA